MSFLNQVSQLLQITQLFGTTALSIDALFKDGNATIEKKSTIRLLIDKLRIAYPKRAEQARAVIEHVQSSPFNASY